MQDAARNSVVGRVQDITGQTRGINHGRNHKAITRGLIMNNEIRRKRKEFAIKQSKVPRDVKFNKGREDCINGECFTESAKYFLECAGYFIFTIKGG